MIGLGHRRDGRDYVHRVAWQLAYGPVPHGCEIHHKCKNKLCCNPRHLIAILHKQHRALHLKTMCKRGHKFTAANTYYRPDTGVRQCRKCRALHMQAYFERQ